MADHVVRFAPNQTLPPGYEVLWFEGCEMYGWVSGDKESVVGWDRFRARREAWAHFKKQQTQKETSGA